MDDHSASDQTLLDAQAENHAHLMELSTCDATHKRECKKHCQFVAGDPTLATSEAPFLSRRNIDHCFAREIPGRMGLVNGIARVVNAPEWFAAKVEHVGAIALGVVLDSRSASSIVPSHVAHFPTNRLASTPVLRHRRRPTSG